jgi:dihydrofolate reductase
MGHSIIMGRKTFESIGKPLPGRNSIIITHQQNYVVEGCQVVHSLSEAIALVGQEAEAFVIGGAQIYEQAMHLANKIYYTKIQHTFEGDAFFPEVEAAKWNLVSRENYSPDDKNKFNYSFSVFERI